LEKIKKYENKVAVITGGNSGIGYCIADELISRGAKVVITGRNKKALNEVERALGSNVTGIVANQASLSDLGELVKKVEKKFGSIDTLVINAGIFNLLPIEAISEEQFDETMNVNFKGAFFILQKFLPLFKNGSSVIFILALSGTQGTQNRSEYNVSEAAVKSLARVAAIELAPKGIRVNAIAPGPFDAPIFCKSDAPQEKLDQFEEAIWVKRYSVPDELGKLVTCILSYI
jgi:NAD(P)-dependent dehydrogenase (short-subunit alcohol dehydrogenase family)